MRCFFGRGERIGFGGKESRGHRSPCLDDDRSGTFCTARSGIASPGCTHSAICPSAASTRDRDHPGRLKRKVFH